MNILFSSFSADGRNPDAYSHKYQACCIISGVQPYRRFRADNNFPSTSPKGNGGILIIESDAIL